MNRLISLLSALLIMAPCGAWGLEVASVYPEMATPEAPVTVIGGPFEQGVQVMLGDTRVEPRILSSRQLVFLVPALEPGAYALSLIDEQRHSDQVFQLQVILPAPEIEVLTPQSIDECYDQTQHEVTLQGRHLDPQARVLLDNRVTTSGWINDRELRFEAPRLAAGMYGVQVINPDGSASLPHSLEFSNAPEIRQVRVGEDFVNYYQLVIEGKNFFYRSILVVSEYPVGLSDLPPIQRSLVAQKAPAQFDNLRQQRREALYYQDCHTLIYSRHPLSGESRRLVLRVSNPDGKQTRPFEISTP